MMDSMEEYGMNARVSSENFKDGACGRIPVEYTRNVFAQTLPKRHNKLIQIAKVKEPLAAAMVGRQL
jgi:hypothetical protein